MSNWLIFHETGRGVLAQRLCRSFRSERSGNLVQKSAPTIQLLYGCWDVGEPPISSGHNPFGGGRRYRSEIFVQFSGTRRKSLSRPSSLLCPSTGVCPLQDVPLGASGPRRIISENGNRSGSRDSGSASVLSAAESPAATGRSPPNPSCFRRSLPETPKQKRTAEKLQLSDRQFPSLFSR